MYFKIPNPVTMMIVDASKQNYELFRTIAGFSDTPVRSFQKENIDSAINYLSSNNITNLPPEIVFCNARVGDKSGIDFLEGFAKTDYAKDNAVPVYLISSENSLPDEEKAAIAFPFFKGYLQNPVQIEELNNILLRHNAVVR